MKCGRCGKPLTNIKSILRGFGPVCWKKIAGNKTMEQYIDKGEEENNNYLGIHDYFEQLDTEYKCSCGTYLVKYGGIDHYAHSGGYLVNGYKERQWIFITCSKCGLSISFKKLGVKEIGKKEVSEDNAI